MGIPRTVRRSALTLLVGATLATILSISTAAAAPLHSADSAGPTAGTTARTDVWMRDTATDVGAQPHGLNPLWASPDIKVCPTAIECPVSQNPIVGMTNYIFVKLRNAGPYGSGTDNGTLRVYRTTPGGGAAWPADWTPIGGVAATVPAGVTTVTIPWTGVPGPGHFCLLARWSSASDPMTIEGPDITVNTRYNNNIAWRNVDSVRVTPGGPGSVRPFAIGNPLDRPTRNDILFTPVGAAFQDGGGRVVVDLGPALFERWQAGGKAGTGIRDLGRNQLEIVDPGRASIGNLVLNPG